MVGHSHWNVIGQEKVNPQTGIIDPSLCSADRVCEEEPLSIITGGGGGINSEAKATENNGMYGFIDFHVTPTHFNARIINWAGEQSSPLLRGGRPGRKGHLVRGPGAERTG